jgi:predicted membrane-bound spermidine synthase
MYQQHFPHSIHSHFFSFPRPSSKGTGNILLSTHLHSIFYIEHGKMSAKLKQPHQNFALLLLLLLLLLMTPTASSHASKPSNAVGEYISESGFYQSITLTDDKPVFEKKSKFQDISVLNSKHYGKILMLDGVIQLTEKDADSYNEMMAHPAMFSHPKPKRVLVIGGGDGYVLSEVSYHLYLLVSSKVLIIYLKSYLTFFFW